MNKAKHLRLMGKLLADQNYEEFIKQIHALITIETDIADLKKILNILGYEMFLTYDGKRLKGQ